MKYNIGDKVKIIGNKYGHGFNINQIVEIIKVYKDHYDVKDLEKMYDLWSIDDDECEKIDRFQVGDFVKDKDGNCWTIKKVHEDKNNPHDIDVVEACMSFKSENLIPISKEAYEDFHSLLSKDDLCDNVCEGQCEDCTCGKNDYINQPNHYCQGKIECIDYILDQNMNFLEGNIIKYVTRYKYKNGLEDLKKARIYLNHLIDNYEN